MSLKEQNYKKHIRGMGQELDKLQQGDFNYTHRAPYRTTLSAYAAQLRKEIKASSQLRKV